MIAVDVSRLILWLLVAVVAALAALAIAVASGYATSRISAAKQRSARAGFWWGFGVPIVAIAVAALRQPAAGGEAATAAWAPSRRLVTRLAAGVTAAAILVPLAGVTIYTQLVNDPAPRIDDEDHLFGLVSGDDTDTSEVGASEFGAAARGVVGAIGPLVGAIPTTASRTGGTEPADGFPAECDSPDPSEPPIADDTADEEATGEFDGDWIVSGGSEVGYRVPEDLAGVQTEAVGRTVDVTGGIIVAGDSVTAACFVADMTTVESDQNLRDGQFHGRIMATGDHPTAVFVLTEPIVLDVLPEVGGDAITAEATGELTLRGVTQPVTVDVTVVAGNPDGEQVLVAVGGTIAIGFDDYDIPDASGGPARVGRDGELEFAIVLTRM